MIRSIDELPTKRSTKKRFKSLPVAEFLKMEKKFKSAFAWGTQVNNPCEIYKTSDGKEIEAYGVKQFGIVTNAFIEE